MAGAIELSTGIRRVSRRVEALARMVRRRSMMERELSDQMRRTRERHDISRRLKGEKHESKDLVNHSIQDPSIRGLSNDLRI